MNRVVCGGVAGVVGLLTGFLVDAVETRLFGVSSRRSFWVVFLGVGAAVMWVADRFGFLSSAYSSPTIDIYEKHDAKSDTSNPGGSIVDVIDIEEL